MTNDRLNETLALVDELVQAVTIASHDLSGVMEKRRAKEASNDLRIAIAKLCNAPEPKAPLRARLTVERGMVKIAVLEGRPEIPPDGDYDVVGTALKST